MIVIWIVIYENDLNLSYWEKVYFKGIYLNLKVCIFYQKIRRIQSTKTKS